MIVIILAIAVLCFVLVATSKSCPRVELGYACKGPNCEPGCPDALMVAPLTTADGSGISNKANKPNSTKKNKKPKNKS